jgi:SAM-dependent methyltransferase
MSWAVNGSSLDLIAATLGAQTVKDSVTNFYDRLADDYHLLFQDWKQTVRRQGEILNRILTDRLGPGPFAVVDCCCGIGTQAIALALYGHRIRATDISARAVERARAEARAQGVEIEFGIADLRNAAATGRADFDAAIACDNGLPHLLGDADLQMALQLMASHLRPGGVFLATIRDYDELIEQRPHATPVRVFDDEFGRRIVFQVWDWLPSGSAYRLTQFLVAQKNSEWRTASFATEYRALLRSELNNAIGLAGLVDVSWLNTAESGFYQPVVTARKPG